MGELMKGLAIDYWYKALLVVSVGVMILALTVPLQVPNVSVLLIAAGGFVHSLGQWINHPYQERIGVGFKISSHNRQASIGGVALEIAGVLLACAGVWVLVRT
jgi:hypothetical protein